jgi:chromosome segregation ATPase
MKSDFKQVFDELFPRLDEQGKSLLRKMALIHDEREQYFYGEIDGYREDIEAYETEVDERFDQIEKLADETGKLTNETEKYEDLKIKLKNKIKYFKKERKKLVSEKRGIAVSKGRLKSKYGQAVDAMEDIYDICDANRFTNIDNLKRRMRRITGAFVHCSDCKLPLNDCQCE